MAGPRDMSDVKQKAAHRLKGMADPDDQFLVDLEISEQAQESAYARLNKEYDDAIKSHIGPLNDNDMVEINAMREGDILDLKASFVDDVIEDELVSNPDHWKDDPDVKDREQMKTIYTDPLLRDSDRRKHNMPMVEESNGEFSVKPYRKSSIFDPDSGNNI